MSTSRSSSVRPWGEARAVSHTVSPVFSDTAMTLPLSNPLIATSLAMMGVAVPRRLRRGTCCSSDQTSLPSCALKPCSRPSTERITTTFSLIAGADSSSEFTCVRHNWRPVAPSSATITPLLVPTTTIPAPAPGPAESGNFRFLTQRCAAGLQRCGQHLALVGGGEYHAVVDRRPQPEAQHRLLLAAADALAPQFLHRQRRRKFDQSCGRLDIFVFAATGGDQQRREAQGKQ